MTKIGIMIINKALLPKLGESFEIKDFAATDAKTRFGIELQGFKLYANNSEEIKNQIGNDVSLASEIYSTLNFKENKITGTVVETRSYTNVSGNTNDIVLLELISTPIAPAKTNPKTTLGARFKGAVQAFPALVEAKEDYDKNGSFSKTLTIRKDGEEIYLFYGDDKIGKLVEKADDASEIKKRMKSFDDNKSIEIKECIHEMGIFKTKIDISALEVSLDDIISDLEDVKQHALTCGVTEEQFSTYVSLMVNTYNIPVKLVKMIISSWRPMNERYTESYVDLSRIAAKDKNGNIHPLYIDDFENVRRCAAYLVSGRENLCLKGEASVGKNILIETLAGLFRKPLLRESLSGGSDLGVLLGDRNVNADGSIGFDPSQLVKAAEDGCWIILDEINTVPTEFLTVLHSLLESDVRAINVPFYQLIKAHNDFRVFATMNPVDTGDYVGTKELNSATASRFKTLEIVSNANFEDVLRNACPEAKPTEIKKVAELYSAIKAMKQSKTTDLSSGFLAIRRYISILDDGIANEYISLKDRCIDSLAQANPNDKTQSAAIIQTITDKIG